MDPAEAREFSAREAVRSLGYLKASFLPTLLPLIDLCGGHHPRQVATTYRKMGDQISKEEKRALGMRANAFMSRDMLDALTDRGRANAVEALTSTLTRAFFTRSRLASLRLGEDIPYSSWHYAAMFSGCEGCQRLNKVLAVREPNSALPPVDCFRDGCAIMIRLDIDFSQQALDRYRERTGRE